MESGRNSWRVPLETEDALSKTGRTFCANVCNRWKVGDSQQVLHAGGHDAARDKAGAGVLLALHGLDGRGGRAGGPDAAPVVCHRPDSAHVGRRRLVEMLRRSDWTGP